MSHSIRIIFGKEQVDKFLSEKTLTKEEIQNNKRVYYFETKAELIAFKKGVHETVGWMEYYITEDSLSSIESRVEIS